MGRRAWPTWAMVLLGGVCLILGMAINGNIGTSSASTGQAGYKLPPASSAAASAGSSTATTATGGTTATTGAGGTTATTGAGGTTAAGGSTATTGAGGTTATTVAPGPPTVLIPATQGGARPQLKAAGRVPSPRPMGPVGSCGAGRARGAGRAAPLFQSRRSPGGRARGPPKAVASGRRSPQWPVAGPRPA